MNWRLRRESEERETSPVGISEMKSYFRSPLHRLSLKNDLFQVGI